MDNVFDRTKIGTGQTEITRLADFDSTMRPHIETIYEELVAKAKNLDILLDLEYLPDSVEKIIQEALFEIQRLKEDLIHPKNADSRQKVGQYLLTRILHTEERLMALKQVKELE